MATGAAATLPADAALPIAAAAASHPCSCHRRCRETTRHGAAADVAQNHRRLPLPPTMMLRRLAAAEEGRRNHVRRRHPLRCQNRRHRIHRSLLLPPLPPLVQTLLPAVEILQKSCRTVIVAAAAAAVAAVADGDEGPGWRAAMPR